MPFTVDSPDYHLSPFSGMNRNHWVAACTHLLSGAFSHISPKSGRMDLPQRSEILYPRANDPRSRRNEANFEAIARSFLLAAPLLHEQPDLELHGQRVGDWYTQSLSFVSDPQHPDNLYEAIGGQEDSFPTQAEVEGAALVICLWESREALWDQWPQALKDQVAALLHRLAHRQTHGHNWRFFNVLMLSFLKAEGYAYSEIMMQDHLHNLLAWQAGDGWYRDGKHFDYYCPWAFHMYAPIWEQKIGRNYYPDIAEDFAGYRRTFLDTYPLLFARNGACSLWGRSGMYRFAASAALSAGFLDPDAAHDPGWARRICSGNLLQFLSHPDFLQDKVPTPGWFGTFAPMLQPYSCAASPFWLAKAFGALSLSADHPFWTARENEGLWPNIDGVQTSVLSGPGLVVSNHASDGQTQLLSQKVSGKMAPDPNYLRLAYHTAFPWQLSDDDGLSSMGLSVREGSTEGWKEPMTRSYAGSDKGTHHSRYGFGYGNTYQCMDMAIRFCDGGFLLVGRLRIANAYDWCLSGHALPITSAASHASGTTEQGHTYVQAWTETRRVAVAYISGPDADLSLEQRDGLHPEGVPTVTPALRSSVPLYSGMPIIAVLFLQQKIGGPFDAAALDRVGISKCAPMQVDGTLDGESFAIDFREIEGRLSH